MNGPNERAALLEKTQQDLFDKLFKVDCSPGYFERAMKRMTSTADKKTSDLQAASSEAHYAYDKARKAHSVRWTEVFRETRDEMIREATEAKP